MAMVWIASFFYATIAAADSLPPAVLVFDQSIPYAEYFGKLFSSFQATLKASSAAPITIHLERLEYGQFNGS